jgi:hypothetical protein
VCTPIFLEWEAVQFNIFGVDTFSLQNFSLPWSNQSSTQSSLQKFGVHLKSTPNVLECTSSPLLNFCSALEVHSKKNWSALKVHSKKIGVHKIPLQKCQNFVFLEWTAVHSIFFGVDTFALQNVGVHVVIVWSAFSLTLQLYIKC